MSRLIVADVYRREYEQAAIVAKADVIIAEERRRERGALRAPDLRAFPSWSQVSMPSD